jgi:hypothetical protein
MVVVGASSSTIALSEAIIFEVAVVALTPRAGGVEVSTTAEDRSKACVHSSIPGGVVVIGASSSTVTSGEAALDVVVVVTLTPRARSSHDDSLVSVSVVMDAKHSEGNSEGKEDGLLAEGFFFLVLSDEEVGIYVHFV